MINYPLPNEKWRHYKGGIYKSITMAKHSETGEDMVIYQSVPFGTIYARPFSMWHENVKIEADSGDPIPRFAKIDQMLR